MPPLDRLSCSSPSAVSTSTSCSSPGRARSVQSVGCGRDLLGADGEGHGSSSSSSRSSSSGSNDILLGVPRVARFHLSQSDHFVVAVQHCKQGKSLTQSLSEWSLGILEATYTDFHSSFRDWDLNHAKGLQVLVFTSPRDFKVHNKHLGIASQLHGHHSGHFCRRTNQVVLLLEPPLSDESGNSTSSAPQARPGWESTRQWLEIRRCNITHEATHLISFNCGLLCREVEYPWWVVEGLAVCFEVTPQGESPFCGSRTATGPLLHHLVSLHLAGSLLPLTDFSKLTRPPPCMRGLAGWNLMYSQGWALFLLVFRCYAPQLAQYLKEFKLEAEEEMGCGTMCASCFAPGLFRMATRKDLWGRRFRDCFGDAADLQRHWLAFLASMQAITQP